MYIYIYKHSINIPPTYIRVEEVKANIGRVLIASPPLLRLTCRNDRLRRARGKTSRSRDLVNWPIRIKAGILAGRAIRRVNTKLIRSIRRCGPRRRIAPVRSELPASGLSVEEEEEEEEREMGSRASMGNPGGTHLCSFFSGEWAVGGRGEGTRGLRKRPFKGTRAATHLSQSQRHCQRSRGDLNGATPDPFALHAPPHRPFHPTSAFLRTRPLAQVLEATISLNAMYYRCWAVVSARGAILYLKRSGKIVGE